MRCQQRPRQNDLFDYPDETGTLDTLPTANRIEVIRWLGKLLFQLVRAKGQTAI